MNKIKTKDDLKNFLFNFHNLVNLRKGLKESNITILDKYKNANLLRIIQYWHQSFIIKGIQKSRMSDYYSLKKCKSNFVKYIQNNREKFNWN